MQLDCALLAFNFAMAETGRWSAIEVIGSLVLPKGEVQGPFFYIATATFEPQEIELSHIWEAVIVGPDGERHPVIEAVHLPPQPNPYDAWLYSVLYRPLHLSATASGIYQIELRVCGKLLHTMRLQIRIE